MVLTELFRFTCMATKPWIFVALRWNAEVVVAVVAEQGVLSTVWVKKMAIGAFARFFKNE